MSASKRQRVISDEWIYEEDDDSATSAAESEEDFPYFHKPLWVENAQSSVRELEAQLQKEASNHVCVIYGSDVVINHRLNWQPYRRALYRREAISSRHPINLAVLEDARIIRTNRTRRGYVLASRGAFLSSYGLPPQKPITMLDFLPRDLIDLLQKYVCLVLVHAVDFARRWNVLRSQLSKVLHQAVVYINKEGTKACIEVFPVPFLDDIGEQEYYGMDTEFSERKTVMEAMPDRTAKIVSGAMEMYRKPGMSDLELYWTVLNFTDWRVNHNLFAHG
jgi:hypothetical protein